MYGMLVRGFMLCALLLAGQAQAEENVQQQAKDSVDSLQKPLYNPFVERYVLDELKQIRIDMAAQRNDMIQQIVDREHRSVDRGVEYATNTVTYFFYLIAAATSVLVLVGWTSIRDIKERVQSLADEEINKLINEYENRLGNIEKQLNQKTQFIEKNREEIEMTQEAQALWLRAAQDHNPATKIDIYDQIIKLGFFDAEALTYKADSVLELNEPQWAVNLCHQALAVDPENSHAFYQLACAHTTLEQYDDAVHYLLEAIRRNENYRDEINTDPALKPLLSHVSMDDIVSRLQEHS
jgi:tetratricopeptide (TPR) repeat protein